MKRPNRQQNHTMIMPLGTIREHNSRILDLALRRHLQFVGSSFQSAKIENLRFFDIGNP